MFIVLNEIRGSQSFFYMKLVTDDHNLINRIRSDDSAAFEELFKSYWEPLFAAALYRLKSRDLAQDVLQELFVEVWEKRRSLEIHTNVKGYLNQALKNRIINKIKSEAVRDKYEKMILDHYDVNNLATDYRVSEHFINNEIRKETEILPVRCREVFELSRVEQLSHKEIGEKLNISPKTVENHIGKALKILRPKLKQIISALLLFWM